MTVIATPEELAQFTRNDRYQISDLMLEVYRSNEGLDFVPIIGITDVNAGKTNMVEVLSKELKEEKEILERNKGEQVVLRNASLATIQDVRQQMKEWKALKNGNGTYSISGPGLGWLDGKLAPGQWIFRADIGQMTPEGREGIDLISVLIAN